MTSQEFLNQLDLTCLSPADLLKAKETYLEMAAFEQIGAEEKLKQIVQQWGNGPLRAMIEQEVQRQFERIMLRIAKPLYRRARKSIVREFVREVLDDVLQDSINETMRRLDYHEQESCGRPSANGSDVRCGGRTESAKRSIFQRSKNGHRDPA
jgi:hypothetical protein